MTKAKRLPLGSLPLDGEPASGDGLATIAKKVAFGIAFVLVAFTLGPFILVGWGFYAIGDLCLTANGTRKFK